MSNAKQFDPKILEGSGPIKLSLWDKFCQTKFYNWIWHHGGWQINSFFTGVKNIIRWIPILYKDRDWDHTYIMNILKQKLIFQEKYLRERNLYVGVGRDCEIMRLCVKLIDLVNDETYEMEYFDYDKDWRKTQNRNPMIYNDYFAKHKAEYNKMMKDQSWKLRFASDNKHIIAMQLSQRMHLKAKRLLFKILEERIESWWD